MTGVENPGMSFSDNPTIAGCITSTTLTIKVFRKFFMIFLICKKESKERNDLYKKFCNNYQLAEMNYPMADINYPGKSF